MLKVQGVIKKLIAGMLPLYFTYFQTVTVVDIRISNCMPDNKIPRVSLLVVAYH